MFQSSFGSVLEASWLFSTFSIELRASFCFADEPLLLALAEQLRNLNSYIQEHAFIRNENFSTPEIHHNRTANSRMASNIFRIKLITHFDSPTSDCSSCYLGTLMSGLLCRTCWTLEELLCWRTLSLWGLLSLRILLCQSFF